MEKRKTTYLAIAITSKCNYSCFYCKKGGESISCNNETIAFSDLKKVIKNAIKEDIRNFRITGGEPTAVNYFGDLLEFIMQFENTKIRINTNGFKLINYIEILSKYKERIGVVISIDSISEYLEEIYFPKYLSEKVITITRMFKEREIDVRYNIVVTQLNKSEVERLVLKAIKELHVNVKLLDLNKFSDYLGYNGEVSGEEAVKMWKELFVPMSEFKSFLESISNKQDFNWTTGLVRKTQGIPMSAYFCDDNWIQVKDSTRGARYSQYCRSHCANYTACQEGVFSLFLSANLMLSFSGCKNDAIHFNLNGCDDLEIQKSIKRLVTLMN